MWSETELAFRRARYEELRAAWVAAGEPERAADNERQRLEQRVEILPSIEGFVAGALSAVELREAIDTWSRQKPIFGFGGTAGAMFLNQLVKDSAQGEADPVLRDAFKPPVDLADAVRKIDAVAAFASDLRTRGSGAAVARAPFFTSWFWWMQTDEWQPIWIRAEQALVDLAWFSGKRPAEGERYRRYGELVAQLTDNRWEADEVLSWVFDAKTVDGLPMLGLDSTLVKRCQRSYDLPREEDAANVAGWTENLVNAQVVLAELKRFAERLAGAVSEELGLDVAPRVPGPFWVPKSQLVRGASWSAWQIQTGTDAAPSIRLTVDAQRITISLNAEVAMNRKGTLQIFRDALSGSIEGDLTPMMMDTTAGRFLLCDVGVDDLWTAVGVAVEPEAICDPRSVESVLRNAVRKLAPLAREFEAAVLGAGTGTTPTPHRESTTSDLAHLFARFVAEVGYPSPDDHGNIAAGVEFRQLLDRQLLAALSKPDLRRIIASKYGSPGPQSVLNSTVRDADDEEWARIIRTIDYLLWGTDAPTAERVDRVLLADEYRVKGLGAAVAMKLLAIAHPDEIVLVYPYEGDQGKATILASLGLPLPSAHETAGHRHLVSSAALRSFVAPVITGDPWGEMRFLYWLHRNWQSNSTYPDEPAVDIDDLGVRLDELATRVYVDREFIHDIHQQLSKHRQAVFFGPPGTGKTLIAKELAKVVAPGDGHHVIVQFHPSTSYEDFVEGYRPVPLEGGQLGYSLVPGPLRMMATAAADDSANLYVLIIDEINRANLPKVLGELLFLLEYRDESVQPMYRPDEQFQLPKNLWIIGTMNTADRSIALVDAAIRRRFQFIDFTPDLDGTNPVSNVLRNWVERHGELEVLPDIVDTLNSRLRAELGGEHLAFGPSYFMKPGIDEKELRRVWRFQIEPLISDLFFGDAKRRAKFSFDSIWDELTPNAGGTESRV